MIDVNINRLVETQGTNLFGQGVALGSYTPQWDCYADLFGFPFHYTVNRGGWHSGSLTVDAADVKDNTGAGLGVWPYSMLDYAAVSLGISVNVADGVAGSWYDACPEFGGVLHPPDVTVWDLTCTSHPGATLLQKPEDESFYTLEYWVIPPAPYYTADPDNELAARLWPTGEFPAFQLDVEAFAGFLVGNLHINLETARRTAQPHDTWFYNGD